VHIKPQRAMQTLDLQLDRRQGRCPSDSVTKLSTQGNFDLDSPLLNAYNASTDAGRVRRPYSLTDRPSCAAGRAADSSRPSFSRGQAAQVQLAWPSCLQLSRGERKLDAAGVFLFLGIMTSPSLDPARRDAVRNTWLPLQQPAAARACFVIGRRSVSSRSLPALDTEADTHGDIFFLAHTFDGCTRMVTIAKAFAWWQAAERAVRGTAVRFVAKVDDDSFVNLPILALKLRPLAACSHVYSGVMPMAGYRPLAYLKCGFSWRNHGAWKKYNCAAAGAHPPFPFALGQLEILSSSVVSKLASSAEATEFAVRAGPSAVDEDAALGFVLNKLHETRVVNLTYASMRIASASNFACHGGNGLYRPPQNSSVVVHYLKKPSWMHYVWSVVNGSRGYSEAECRHVTGIRWR